MIIFLINILFCLLACLRVLRFDPCAFQTLKKLKSRQEETKKREISRLLSKLDDNAAMIPPTGSFTELLEPVAVLPPSDACTTPLPPSDACTTPEETSAR